MNKEGPPYSVADIQRYLKGEMSNSDMRLLEIEALNDPFLQDAIDGFRQVYANHESAAIEPILRAVETYEPAATEMKNDVAVIPIWRRKIVQYAVASALILGTGWYLFNLTQPESVITGSKNKDASAKVSAATADSAVAISPAETQVPLSKKEEPSMPLTGSTQNEIKPVTKPEISSVTLPDERAKAGPLNNPESKKAGATVNNKIETEQVLESESAKKDISASVDHEVYLPPSTAATVQQKAGAVVPDITSKQPIGISGKVMDTAKYPLDNITLREKGSSNGVVSDELGRFQINVAESTVTLVASGNGYETKEFKTHPGNAKLEVELEPSKRSLNEMVVNSYRVRKSKSVTSNKISHETDTSEASPSGGWKNFEEYILQNKQVKSSGQLPVAVVLSFEINGKGRPAEFDIIESAGASFDDEAIRLLKAGPSWINKTRGNAAMAKITILF